MELKVGIRGHDLVTKSDVFELVKKLKLHDINYLQLVFPKTFKDYSYSEEYVKTVKEEFGKNNIKVIMLGAYFNPVHSDKVTKENGINNFKSNLDIAKFLNNPYVGSETGSYNDSPWTYVPKNHTDEAFEEVYSVFKDLVDYASKINEKVIIEPVFNHCIYDPYVLEKLVKRLDSPNVYVTIDLYNLLSLENYNHKEEVFLEALKLFNNRVKVIHLKDSKLIEGKITQVDPFKGDFDYKFMLETINKYAKDAVLVFEGVKEDAIDFALKNLKEIAKSID